MAIVTRLERKSRRWEQVWSGDSESLANIIAGRLESDGFRTRIHGSMTPYRTAALSLGGTWSILVPHGKAVHARDALRDYDEGHNVVEDDSSGGLTKNQRATLQAAILFGVALAIWAFAVEFLR